LNCQLQGQLHDDISYHGDVNTLHDTYSIVIHVYIESTTKSHFSCLPLNLKKKPLKTNIAAKVDPTIARSFGTCAINDIVNDIANAAILAHVQFLIS